MYELQRLFQNIGIERGDCRYRVADVAHLVNRQRVLILAGGQDAIFARQILAANHGQHARQRQRAACIDGENARVRVGRAQQASIDHARQHNIIGVEGATGHFAIGINLGARRTNHFVGRVGDRSHQPGLAQRLLLAHLAPPLSAMRRAAASTAS